jgi:dihydroorotate dehydrogenase
MVGAIRWTERLGGDRSLRIVSGAASAGIKAPILVFGMPFASRVGLAAGFDKDAEIVSALPALGFGFAEIGTVTPRAQAGNPKPRLFRDLARESLFNRMGFNGAGAEVVAERLSSARKRISPHYFGDFRIGLNIGKNKDTPLEEAAIDYAWAASAFGAPGLVDYLVINVSSPNTAGLRSLQTVEALKPIVEAVDRVTQGWKKRPPLLLKLAPEVKSGELTSIITEAERWGIDGWVLTNTLAGQHGHLSGGWSGQVLTELARERLREARAASRRPIVSVGGIMDAEEASARIRLGADLIQIYSGWIFGGPSFPSKLSAKLSTEIAKK